jgi:hypothetical protein
MLRSVLRQAWMGPDPSHFVRAQEAMDTANLALFRFRQFLDAPFPEFQALVDKIWTFIQRLSFFFVNATVVTGLMWTILICLTPPGKPWMEAPAYFLGPEGSASGKAVMISWIVLMFLGLVHFYRTLRPRFSLEEDVRRR